MQVAKECSKLCHRHSKNHHQTNLGPIKRMQIQLILFLMQSYPASSTIVLLQYVGRMHTLDKSNHSIYRKVKIILCSFFYIQKANLFYLPTKTYIV